MHHQAENGKPFCVALKKVRNFDHPMTKGGCGTAAPHDGRARKCDKKERESNATRNLPCLLTLARLNRLPPPVFPGIRVVTAKWSHAQLVDVRAKIIDFSALVPAAGSKVGSRDHPENSEAANNAVSEVTSCGGSFSVDSRADRKREVVEGEEVRGAGKGSIACRSFLGRPSLEGYV